MKTSSLRKIGKTIVVTVSVALTLMILWVIAVLIALSQDGVQFG